MHRQRRKTRLTARHAIFAFAPLLAAYLVAAERVTLGESLDLLWLLLTVAAIMHCLEQRVSRATRVRQLLSLALVLVVFFPVISPDDDRALAELPELQSLIAAPEKQKAPHAVAVDHAPALTVTPQFSQWLHVAAERVTPVRVAISQRAWRQASGNHSPPLV